MVAWRALSAARLPIVEISSSDALISSRLAACSDRAAGHLLARRRDLRGTGVDLRGARVHLDDDRVQRLDHGVERRAELADLVVPARLDAPGHVLGLLDRLDAAIMAPSDPMMRRAIVNARTALTSTMIPAKTASAVPGLAATAPRCATTSSRAASSDATSSSPALRIAGAERLETVLHELVALRPGATRRAHHALDPEPDRRVRLAEPRLAAGRSALLLERGEIGARLLREPHGLLRDRVVAGRRNRKNVTCASWNASLVEAASKLASVSPSANAVAAISSSRAVAAPPPGPIGRR
jgi:hypothetical protein